MSDDYDDCGYRKEPRKLTMIDRFEAWCDRHLVAIHLVVMGLGVLCFMLAFITGDWRPLIFCAFAYWFTVYK